MCRRSAAYCMKQTLWSSTDHALAQVRPRQIFTCTLKKKMVAKWSQSRDLSLEIFFGGGPAINRDICCCFTTVRKTKSHTVTSLRDIRPSMVTHTRNLCSAFNPCAHTQQWTHTQREHTPGAVGSHLCCGAQGAVGGSVPCSRAPQSWYWRWRLHCTFTLSTYNSCWPETRSHNLSITSPTL